jgi:hypothetical protein
MTTRQTTTLPAVRQEECLLSLVTASQVACERLSEVYLAEAHIVVATAHYLSAALAEAKRGGMSEDMATSLLDDFKYYCALMRACGTTAVATSWLGCMATLAPPTS